MVGIFGWYLFFGLFYIYIYISVFFFRIFYFFVFWCFMLFLASLDKECFLVVFDVFYVVFGVLGRVFCVIFRLFFCFGLCGVSVCVGVLCWFMLFFCFSLLFELLFFEGFLLCFNPEGSKYLLRRQNLTS